jgi:hypothetical protein
MITVYISNNMESVSTYSEARNEYLKQLATWIVPYMIQHYRNVWADTSKAVGPQRAMVVFQEKCAEVPKWNQDMIDANVSKLLDSCRCDYLEELMAAVFIAHTKVLIAIRVSSKHKKLQITLPKLDHFIHRVFSECARSFWKAPYLFLDDQKPIEQQKNLLQAEALCTEAIAGAVRSLLPIKNILNEYLAEDVMVNEPLIEDKKEEVAEPKRDSPPKPSAVEESSVVEDVKAPVVSNIGSESPRKARRSRRSSSDVGTDEETEVKVTKVDMAPEPPVVQAAQPVVEHAGGGPETAAVSEIKELVTNAEIDAIQIPFQPESKPVIEEAAIDMPPSILKKTAPVEPEEIVIDTAPSVHFNNYDTHFDEGKSQVASFAYVPKDLEEGVTPHLEIREESAAPLSLDADVTNLDAPGSSEQVLAVDEILE